LDGKPHQRQRKLVMPPSMENGCGSGSLICELTEQMMKPWRIGKSFNLFACMENHSKCSLKCCFGLTGEGSEQRRKLLALVELATSHCWPPSLLPPLRKIWDIEPMGRFLRYRMTLINFYAEIAQRHKQLNQSARTFLPC